MVTSADERRAFIAAIRANQADDAPRLVFADWLEERGESERAEFIRVQCEFDSRHRQRQNISNPTAEYLADYARKLFALRDRERELLMVKVPSYGRECVVVEARIGWACDQIRDHCLDWKWNRGDISHISISAADWLTHAESILAEHPVTEVRLSDSPAMVIPVAEQGFENRSLVFVIAGKRTRHPWTFTPQPSLQRPGRTPEWCKAILEVRWPGIVFHLPEAAPFIPYLGTRSTPASQFVDAVADIVRQIAPDIPVEVR